MTEKRFQKRYIEKNNKVYDTWKEMPITDELNSDSLLNVLSHLNSLGEIIDTKIERGRYYLEKYNELKELEIKKISHAGGNVVLSPASGNIYSVEKLCKTGETIPYAYRCYFIKEDGDAQIQNMWRVGDMVKCQTFNLSGVAQDTVNVLYD